MEELLVNNQNVKPEKLLEDICGVVREASKIIINAVRTKEMVEAKSGHANFVTTYDKKVQDYLEKGLLEIIPEAHFAGEEGEDFDVPITGYTYVVDPIDGTTNFICDLHTSCISVGLLKDGERIIGVIFNPYLNEMFTAIKGQGAYVNGDKIAVTTSPTEIGLSLFGTAPYNMEYAEESFEKAYKLFLHCADVRRGGSAAIDLCTVAAGRANIYFERVLSPWDFAAGSLIVEEAGGTVTDMEGRPMDVTKKCSIIARGKNVEDVVKDVFFS